MPNKYEPAHQPFVDSSVEMLRASGVRVTKARLAVLSALSQLEKPHNAREVFELVAAAGQGGTKVDQVTVYRILSRFEELGLVHRVLPSGGYFPCFHQHCDNSPHILIRCSSCEQISELDVPEATVAPMFWYLKGEHGFSPNAHVFQVNGVCSSCSVEPQHT